MRKQVSWGLVLALLLALIVGLAACDDEATGGDDDAAPSLTPSVTGTVPAPQNINRYEPGLVVRQGLDITKYSGTRGETGYFYARITNDTGLYLQQAYIRVEVLEPNGRLAQMVETYSLLSDIPPDQPFYLGTHFPIPAGYAPGTPVEEMAKIWVRWENPPDGGNEPSYVGEYDLPVTVTEQTPVAGGPNVYMVQGTVENPSDREFFALAIDVVLIGPDDNIVGFAQGVTAPGLTLLPGDTAPFEAPFRFIAVEPALITAVEVYAAGY